jgi:hypothetical protein
MLLADWLANILVLETTANTEVHHWKWSSEIQIHLIYLQPTFIR